MMAQAHAVPSCVLEDVARKLASVDPHERRSACGRLILAPDALHHVPGWQIHEHIDRRQRRLDAPDRVDFRGEGARLLADVASLAPAEQVRRIDGSITVPVSDIESAGLSLLASVLRVITEQHGEVLDFVIERRDRKPVQAWLAALPRR